MHVTCTFSDMEILYFTYAIISFFSARCESSPNPEDTSEARKLFALSDTNFDHQLTYDEFDDVFMSFDINGE